MARKGSARKKVTFLLSSYLLEQMKEVIEAEQSGSQDRFVEEALQEHIKKVRRASLQRQYVLASRDPLFISDVKQVEQDFGPADIESSGLVE